MFDIYLIIDSFVILSLLLLSAVSLIKNSRAKLHRYFAYFVICVAIWIAANYISNDINNSPDVAHVANYFVFSFSYFATYFMLRFAIEITSDGTARRLIKKMWPLLTLIGLVSGTNYVVQGVHLQDRVYAVDFGPLVGVYAAALLMNLGLNLWILGRNLRTSSALEHARLRVLFLSQLVSLPVLILTQFILPALTGAFELTNIGVLAMLGVVYGLYYSAAKHKLFDIRFVVVRALGYMMSIGAMILFYSFVVLFIIDRVTSIQLSANAQIVLLTSVALSGLLFQPFKRVFDGITARIFYRDAYDAQELYDKLNRLLVSSLDIQFVMNQTSRIIVESLRVEYCEIALVDGNNSYRRFGVCGSKKDLKYVNEFFANFKGKTMQVLITDSIELEHLKGLKEYMISNNIRALIRLVRDDHDEKQEVGYILLGAKNSGRPFNQDDVRALKAVSNELMLAIQNALHFEEIQNFNLTLQEKVDDATRKYRTANEKLKKLDETKDEFISMASHQLRTPLTSVKGYLSMVLEGDAGPLKPQQQELLKQSFMSSQRMVNLIADLLNLSRLNTGKFVIDAAPTDLRVIVDQEVAQLRETARAKDIEVVWNMPPSFSLLNLDENKMHQVVMNFIDNALYYTPNGGRVEVSLTETATAVEYRVKDNGIGVPRELQRHLFTKFYRADNARRMRPDGTGLGLYMAQKVVVAQGGTVLFESQEGKGSTFGFRFNKNKK